MKMRELFYACTCVSASKKMGQLFVSEKASEKKVMCWKIAEQNA
ncbi:hypothetical protein LJPFL01_0456 [Lelliottia jeotgali]|jgi:hypothetical protein|nr:hypothetical protein LJPFL01_0456 [Lelliottia jeotgali]